MFSEEQTLYVVKCKTGNKVTFLKNRTETKSFLKFHKQIY